MGFPRGGRGGGGGGGGVDWLDLGQDRNSECSDTNLLVPPNVQNLFIS
jgi:hypothetical protein